LSAVNQFALQVAALRGTGLAVLHIVEALDLDITEAYQRGPAEEVNNALVAVENPDLPWRLHLRVGEVAAKVLELTREAGASILVIGARHQSPVGKFLLGSVAQTLILEAEVPVIVVKPPR